MTFMTLNHTLSKLTVKGSEFFSTVKYFLIIVSASLWYTSNWLISCLGKFNCGFDKNRFFGQLILFAGNITESRNFTT